MLKKLKNKLCDPKTGKLKTGVIVAIGMIGIALIFLSSLDLGKTRAPEETAKPETTASAEAFREQQESRLTNILSKISGAGKVDVMISVEGSTEYVYLQKYENKSDTAQGEQSVDYRSEPVVIKDGSPVISKVVSPKVTGVLIVADGAGSAAIDEKLINAAAAALGISTANICVARRSG